MAAVAGLLVLPAVVAEAEVASVAPCGVNRVSGNLGAIAGTGGLGRVDYRLRLHNRSAASCFVAGVVGAQMVDRSGRPVTTVVRPEPPGAGTAARIVLRPAANAWARLRFSPCSGRDQPLVTSVRVTIPPVGARLLVLMHPPRAICGPQVVISLLQATRPS